MFKKLKAAISRRRKNAAAGITPAARSTSRPDDANCPLNPLNPVGIHSPLHPINQAAYVSEPDRRCDDNRSSWGSSSDYSSSCSSDSSSSSSSPD